MRFYMLNSPKINIDFESYNKAIIYLFVGIYLSPLMFQWFILDNDEYLILFIVCLYYLSSLFLAECVVFKERIKNYRCFKKRLRRYIKLIFMAMMHCFGIEFCLVFISSKLASGKSANQESISTIPIVILLVLVLLYAPVVEEVLFRYVIRRIIRNDILFIIVSGTVFGTVHIISSIGTHSVVEVIAYSLPHLGVGYYLSYLYASTNSIEACIITHRFLNVMAAFPIVLMYMYR